MKRFYLMGILLMLTALAGYLLAGVNGTFNQQGFGLWEAGLGILGCLYIYGAGVFLYARRERLLAWKTLSDKGVKHPIQS